MNSKRKAFMKYLFGMAGLWLLAFAVAACGEVALGSVINTKGPVVVITEPTQTPDTAQALISVAAAFNLRGTASGDNDVVRIDVTMAYYNPSIQKTETLGREWRFEGGAWKYKEDGYLPWKVYAAADYESLENLDPETVQAPRWVATPREPGNTVNWNLPILLHNMETGDYFITVNAWDSAGHHDSGSSQMLKVYFVNREPQFNVTAPDLVPGKLTPDIRNPEVPDEIRAWVYDPVNRPEETYLNISNWVTEPLDLRWTINDEAARPYRYLKIELANRHQLDDFTGKELYYVREFPNDSRAEIPKNGILTDGAVPFDFVKAGPAITGIKPPDQGPENPPRAELPRDTPTYIQVISTLHDGSGNKATRRSRGFLAYLPAADKPWVDIKFGGKWDDSAGTPPLAILDKYLQKELANNLSWAYSRYELKQLSWKLYKLKPNSLDPVGGTPGGGQDGSREKPFTGGEIFPAGRKRANWSFTPLLAYEDGGFKIVVTVEDIRGNTGEYGAYFTVESNATPTVKTLAPWLESTNTYFGTSENTGNFEISGRAQIEKGSLIDRIGIAWIKPDTDPAITAERQLKYTDRNCPEWDKAPPGGVYDDGADARVWELSPENFGPAGGDAESDFFDFGRKLNIFSELNVGPGPEQNYFAGQTFLIRVFSTKTSGKSLASVRSFTTTGDTTPPALAITKVTVTKESGLGSGTYTLPFTAGFKLPALMRGDKIRFEGTWSDDSREHWSGLSPERLKSFFKNFEVTWNWRSGTWSEPRAGEIPMPGCAFGMDGTWTTADYTFTENNLNNNVMAQVSVTDLNNNRGLTGRNGEGEQFEIQLDIPVILRVSSTASDGYYGVNKETDPLTAGSRYIDIFMEFNKNMKFYDVSLGPQPPPLTKAPYLKLNNGGRAYFYAGNGDSTFTFRYFVDGNAASLGSSSANHHGESGIADQGGISSGGRLNVTGIEWASYPQSVWRSVDGNSELTLQSGNDVFRADYPLSLAGSKNIVIDKEPPVISYIVTSTSGSRAHGAGSAVYINVLFNKPVSIPANTAPESFWLNLKGGNLGVNGAKAYYTNMAGPSSISFQYQVRPGDNTDAFAAGEYLNIESISLNGITITDAALNVFVNPGVLSEQRDILRRNSDFSRPANLAVDTAAPGVPVVQILNPTSTGKYYEAKSFSITGLESAVVTVEYSLNYSGDPANATWVTAPSAPRGNAPNQYYVNDIEIRTNGSYMVAVRQSDNATTPNTSPVSTAVPVIIDAGALLTRLGSGTPDGIYGYRDSPRQTIEIDLNFRIPVYLYGATPADIGGASLILNVKDRNGVNRNRRAKLSGGDYHRNAYTTLTFTYELEYGDSTDANLDVEDIDWASLKLYDSSAGGTLLNDARRDFIRFDRTITNHQFARQKSITLLAGFPEVLNKSVGTVLDGARDIAFKPAADGYEMLIRFDRDIYRGDTADKLVFRQIQNDYRIPPVLSTARWDRIFSGAAAGWKDIGTAYYQKGSNGASSSFAPDTSVKYVLNYAVNPLDETAAGVFPADHALSGKPNVNAVEDRLREAEKIQFDCHDRNISIDGRILKIRLTGDSKLPVMGAEYQWEIPNGFVKDVLNRYNGDGVSADGRDTSLSSGDGVSGFDRLLKTPGIEAPVIRIDKGEDREKFNGTGDERQALQPLTSKVKIDCRTPGSGLSFQKRETADNVGRLIMREGTGVPYRLPNLGNQTRGDYTSFNKAAGRPQSGNALSPLGEGFDHWTPVESKSFSSDSAYTAEFDIGTNNYNDGGMTIHIMARANKAGVEVYAYEAAYRSVFVFQNTGLRGNNYVVNVGDGFGAPARARVWVRGGDNTSGITAIPDFPVSRDRNLWRKSRLLTPVNINVFRGSSWPYTEFTRNEAAAKVITEADIPGVYNSNGQCLWFWVTWRLNVNAYPDIFAGDLPLSGTAEYQVPQNSKDYYYGWIRAKEHYPVIPGRTTVVETRNPGEYVDGGHGTIGASAVTPLPHP